MFKQKELNTFDPEKSGNNYMMKKGQVIFHEGFPASNLIIIVEGVVKLHKDTPFKTSSILDIRHNGDVIGMEATSDGNKYFSTASAFTDCEILVLDKSALSFVKTNNQKEYDAFIHNSMLNIITSLNNRIFFLRDLNAQAKIAYMLLLFSNNHSKDPNQIIFSREEFSELAEVSRETASRELSILKKKKILKISGRKIEIINKELLQSLLNNLEIPFIKEWDEEMKNSIRIFKD